MRLYPVETVMKKDRQGLPLLIRSKRKRRVIKERFQCQSEMGKDNRLDRFLRGNGHDARQIITQSRRFGVLDGAGLRIRIRFGTIGLI